MAHDRSSRAKYQHTPPLIVNRSWDFFRLVARHAGRRKRNYRAKPCNSGVQADRDIKKKALLLARGGSVPRVRGFGFVPPALCCVPHFFGT
jgi:hypothetical protein